MKKNNLNDIKLELSIKTKNGLDFIVSTSIIWLFLVFVWMLGDTSYNKSVTSFIFGGLMLPLAFLLSVVFKTNWNIIDNPLRPYIF